MTHPLKWKVYPYQGKLYQYNVTDPEDATPIPTGEVITADGWEEERLVIVANGTLPGPPIIVYEGQRLVVHVINKLHSDTVTLHWHGLPQHGTPGWMELPSLHNVPFCQVKASYDFIARPRGTYWYHSHVGTQRTKGLYGALVVRDRNDNMAEHNIVVQGWNHHWSADMDQTMFKNDGIYESRVKWKNSYSLDGEFYSTLLLTSAIINGRGRYYINWVTQEHNNAPLSIFKVRQGQKYRFLVINADNLYPFRISVDNHNISLVATDGYDIRPILAESFVIQAWERYDFVLTADQAIKNYRIRARTLEIEADRIHRADAILRYEKAEDDEPVSFPRPCSVDSKCLVVNWPFPYFPEDAFIDCLQVDNIEAFEINDPVPLASDGRFREYFLNFAFPGIDGYGPSSVNGRRFELPPVSALTQPREIESGCDRTECGEEKVCECTHTLSLDYGDVVQLVIMSMGKGAGGFHPIHLHGYSFYVLKVVFGNYDSTTGHYIGPNTDDINCNGNGNHTTSLCNAAMWRNQSWGGDNIPGLNLLNPPRKDTILVPAGGYAVIRI
ncbi:laccase-like [Mizuhopecten yessoensis]|nr:laccase-like [Mizuhopecten yessoensis]